MANVVVRSSPSPVKVNIQDAFLNHLRRDHIRVTIHLLDGRSFDAHIKNFDRFSIIVGSLTRTDHLIFKHAISAIETAESQTNDTAARR